MCRILFKFHLVPLVLVELFVCRKYGKNRPKWWQTWTHEASGCDRRPGAHLAVPLGPPSGPATSPIRGSYSRANHKLPFKSVLSMDKICSWWIHGPIVIDLGVSTNLPTDLHPNFTMCCPSNRHWEPTIAVGSRGGGMEGWSAPPSAAWLPKAPNRPPTANKYPHASLHYK